MPAGGDFTFGPYRLDLRSQRLLRDNVPVSLQPRQFQLLLVFVERAGELLTKDDLVRSVWQGMAVGDNSLAQAMSQLRRLLDPDNLDRYIETVARVGYRFVAPVSRVPARHTDEQIEALLAPYRALVDGRSAIETLAVVEIARARSTFENLRDGDPNEPTFHVGLANACVFEYEAGRTDAEPRTAALQVALGSAREACRLNPSYAEACATLGFVLAITGSVADGVAALRRSIALEPDNWLHYLRLAFITWGETRLRAARRALALYPGCPMAHWLVATVFVARRLLADAEHEVDLGLAASADDEANGRLAAVALNWLKGLLCGARGADDEALKYLVREVALESRGHVYSRELAANAWYAIGACHWWRRDPAAAGAAFAEALTRVPRHPPAAVGLALVPGPSSPKRGKALGFLANGTGANAAASRIEVIFARAAVLVAQGDAAGAAALVGTAVAGAPAGNAGWILPIEPLLAVWREPEPWAQALACVSGRAVMSVGR